MKLGKRFTALILALVTVLSLTATASAAAAETVTVKLSPNITVTLDGKPQAMADVNGNPVYPVLYGGTTYLPVRAVGNMLGLDVNWNQTAKAVLLTTVSKAEPADTGVKAPVSAKPTDITVQISPDIKVILDGKDQKMTNVNGDPVYPMLYGGTTYLPVRAVSNMLGLKVGWNQSTQTVTLDWPEHTHDPNKIFDGLAIDNYKVVVYYKDNTKELFGLNEFDDILESTQGAFSEESLKIMLQAGIDGVANDPLRGEKTSENAEQLGDKHIGYDWGEIDWSTADKGYVRVKVDNQLVSNVMFEVIWASDDAQDYGRNFLQMDISKTSDWQNIPFGYTSGSYECVTRIYYGFGKEMQLQARFTANVTDHDGAWLVPNVQVAYQSAVNTQAKAKEVTKNCKTDAEKITAVYNFVSSALMYDWELYNSEKANGETSYGRERDPDKILANKKGVCEHYAILMTAMLRSLGIQCKMVNGWLKSNGKWEAHAWVAVKPATGTLNISGMGKDYASYDMEDNPVDPTGWIRLDPTNAHVPSTTSNDSNYKTSSYY